MKNQKRLFNVGDVVVSDGIFEKQKYDDEFSFFVYNSIMQRHQRGDWGELEQIDKEQNEYALVTGSRILSRYEYNKNDIKVIWVITEPNRLQTIVMFPWEY